jgi:hypothetical protein
MFPKSPMMKYDDFNINVIQFRKRELEFLNEKIKRVKPMEVLSEIEKVDQLIEHHRLIHKRSSEF